MWLLGTRVGADRHACFDELLGLQEVRRTASCVASGAAGRLSSEFGAVRQPPPLRCGSLVFFVGAFFLALVLL